MSHRKRLRKLWFNPSLLVHVFMNLRRSSHNTIHLNQQRQKATRVTVKARSKLFCLWIKNSYPDWTCRTRFWVSPITHSILRETKGETDCRLWNRSHQRSRVPYRTPLGRASSGRSAPRDVILQEGPTRQAPTEDHTDLPASYHEACRADDDTSAGEGNRQQIPS